MAASAFSETIERSVVEFCGYLPGGELNTLTLRWSRHSEGFALEIEGSRRAADVLEMASLDYLRALHEGIGRLIEQAEGAGLG
jgi:hypothetical protein